MDRLGRCRTISNQRSSILSFFARAKPCALSPHAGRGNRPRQRLLWVNSLISPRCQCAPRANAASAGEWQMRLVRLSLLIGFLTAAGIATADASSWTPAKFPGEQDRAVQGCADDAQNPGDWFCIVIRCDRPGSPLSLYVSAPGPDIHGDIKLIVDEQSFSVSLPASLKSPLPLSSRAEALPYTALDAMKGGSAISVQGSHIQTPYNRISLENSRKAIERIEWACESPYPSPTRFWRRIVRRLRFM